MPILMMFGLIFGLFLPAEGVEPPWVGILQDGSDVVLSGGVSSRGPAGSSGGGHSSGGSTRGPGSSGSSAEEADAPGPVYGFLTCDLITTGSIRACLSPAEPGTTPTPRPITTDMVEGWARSATTSLHLPASTPVIGPDPSANEWDMLAVGLPVWLWTSEPRTLDASVTASGIDLTLVAHRGLTTFEMGDGTTVTCSTSTVRPRGADPMEKSPTCGHTYSRAGTYAITATTHWRVDWDALGFSGSFDVPRTDTTALEVGELVSVVVR